MSHKSCISGMGEPVQAIRVMNEKRLLLIGGAIIKLVKIFFGLNDFFMHEWC
jgi:hypothetical protein